MPISNIFKRIRPITDSEEQLRLHLLWYLLIRVVLYTLLIGITYLPQSSERQIILPSQLIIFIYITAIYSFSILSALLLKKREINLQRFGKIQIVSDTLFIALLVYATGGTQSVFTPVFILPVLAGGLIMHRIGGLIPAASATLLYGFVLSLEYLQVIPQYFFNYRYIVITKYQVGTSIFAVYGLTFFLIAMLSGVLAKKLRTAQDALTRTEIKFDQLLLLYKQIFDDILTGIITLDSNGVITSYNPAAAIITGYTQAETTGRRFSTLFPHLVTESQGRHVTDFTRKDGKEIKIGYSFSELHIQDSNQFDDPAISSSKVITLEDVSKIEEMEQQIRNAEKMAAIGELSASIAHDFRNPLAAISGSAQILAMDNESDEIPNPVTQRNLTNIILRESERMANTVTDFLHYALPADPRFTTFNLKEIADATVEQLTSERRECFEKVIEINIDDNLELVGDRELIQIALAHLLRNSCYAVRDSYEPIICSAGIDETFDPALFYIEVTDKGCGIDPEIQNKLFDPFFTTREDTSGLGLAIVKQIVTSHNGTLEVTSQLAQGCRVIIRLPTTQNTTL